MPTILLIAGSPTAPSRSALLLDHAAARLKLQGLDVIQVSVRDFPAEDLVQAKFDSPAFAAFKSQVESAAGIIVATPIYKASYTGVLKALLDILPQSALRGKTLLPIATGGSPAHLLAIDYAIKPLLAVLGASDIQQGVYVVDSQFQYTADGFTLDAELQHRLDDSIDRLAATVSATELAPVP